MDSSFEKSHGGIDSIKEQHKHRDFIYQFEEHTWESATNKWNLKQNNMTCRSRKKNTTRN